MLNLSAENATFTAENRGPYICVSVLVNCTNEDLSATTAQLWQCCSCLKQLKLSPRTLSTIKAQNMKNMRD